MADRRAGAPPDFTWRGVQAGATAGVPLAANAGIYGIVFGALAAQTGIDLVPAVVMSVIVCAGGAQVAILPIWAHPIPFVAVWATTFAVNARYILQSASLRPWLSGTGPLPLYGTLFTLSDGSWALSIRRWQNAPIDGGFLLGAGLVQYVTWIAGTLGGHVLGNRIDSPATYGLDFIFPAFFAAMAAGLWKRRSDIGPIIVGAGAALVAERFVAGHWSLLIGGLAGSLVGLFVYDRKS